MATYKVFMGAGIVIAIIGFLLLSSITIYYSDYPEWNYPRTLGEAAIKMMVLAAGAGLYKWGERMRDGR